MIVGYAPGVSLTLLVTGGAGFIGRALVRQLAARGDRVVVLDALTYAAHPDALSRIAGDVELVQGDVADEGVVAGLLDRMTPDAVLHLAAESHVDRALADAAPFLRTNVWGTWQVVRACVQHGVRLVHVSTDEVYGDRSGLPTSLEGDPCAPTNPYSAAKTCGDHLVLSAVRAEGLNAVITRGANTYGPGQYPEKLLPLAGQRWRSGRAMGVYGDGQQVRHWLYVDDHAAGIVAALDRGAPGSIAHFGGEASTNTDVLARWAAALGVPGDTERVEDRPGHDRAYDLDDTATRRALGWSPATALDAGLALTAAWTAAHPQFWDDA